MMRRIYSFLLVLVVLGVFTPMAFAQYSVAVLDVDYLMQESNAAKMLQQKRNKAREELLAQLSVKETALREQGQAIYESRQSAPEEEFIKNSRAYEAELLEMRKLTQEHKRKFEEAAAKSLAALRDFMTGIAEDIAKERGDALVISKRYVIVGEKSLDITQETLTQMNAADIKIPFQVEK